MFMEHADAFATIVGLVASFSSGRDSEKAKDINEFMQWLMDHNHKEVINEIQSNQKTSIFVKALLNREVPEIQEKLDEIISMVQGMADSRAGAPSITAKNLNIGNNYGWIGDRYTGIKQRTVTPEDVSYLDAEIKRFSKEYADQIDFSHITLAYPGCKETKKLAEQLLPILQKMGFNRIEVAYLQTFGSSGKKFGVSNAFDNSVMVEIYPADNVE